MLPKIFNKKSISQESQKLLYYLERVVNIAVIKTEYGENESVKDTLNNFDEIFDLFWALKKNNPDKFDSYLYSADFFSKYVKPKEKKESLDSDKLQDTKSAEELEKEAAFTLSFRPEDSLKGITRFLKAFKKIWSAAVKSDNDDIGRFAVYRINSILSKLSKEPSNQFFIDLILNILTEITYESLKLPENQINRSIYPASIHWYTDIVFRLGRTGDKHFELQYLQTFNSYLFRSAKLMIDENRKDVFTHLVSMLVDGILISTHGGKIWDYGHMLLRENYEVYKKLDEGKEIEKKVKDLAKREKQLYDEKDLNDWLRIFDELRSDLEPVLSTSQLLRMKEIEQRIDNDVTSRYKYNSLLNIVFEICSYSLLKQKYEFIKIVWQYKQPPDTEAIWVGDDIIPETLDDVMLFYFNFVLANFSCSNWDGHHGSQRYRKQYFILLLLKTLLKYHKNSNGEHVPYTLPELTAYRLSDLINSTDDLVQISASLKENKSLLNAVGFFEDNFESIFNKTLVPFIEGLKEKAEHRISGIVLEQNTSSEKIKEFKNNVLIGFNENSGVRDIFLHYDLYSDKTEEETAVKIRFGLSISEDKAAFFEDWHVHYFDWGKNYGRDIANSENRHIAKRLMDFCTESDAGLHQTLDKFENLKDAIIFASHESVYEYFYNSPHFTAKWARDDEGVALLDLEGWYKYKQAEIRVFNIHQLDVENKVMCLNKSRCAKIVQLNPLNEDDDSSYKMGMFYMNVRAFSEHESLMNEFIEKPPKWLKKIGDANKQKEHLSKRALVQIFEKFEIQKHDKFEGYVIDGDKL